MVAKVPPILIIHVRSFDEKVIEISFVVENIELDVMQFRRNCIELILSI
jgi:hypothetical protein